MDKVKKLMKAGAPLADAVRIALGERSLSDVAAERGVNRQNLTSTVNGSRLASPREIDALVAELGGSAEDWRALLAGELHKRAIAAT